MSFGHWFKGSTVAAAAALALWTAPAHAGSTFSSGPVSIGVNDDGSLIDSDGVRSTGTGILLSGFGDALNPDCDCEAWGVSANGISGYVGPVVGNANIMVGAPGGGSGLFTSNTMLGGTGITIKQDWTVAAGDGSTGTLFRNRVTITNTDAATAADVRFGRAMDWDVPPTEFFELVTHKGTQTTTELLYSSDNGFAAPDPLFGFPTFILPGSENADFNDLGPVDHGSLFIFGFGDLEAGKSKVFDIFYGASNTEAYALTMLNLVQAELYSLGQAVAEQIQVGTRLECFTDDFGDEVCQEVPIFEYRASNHAFIFGLAGVGGTPVVPAVPIPPAFALMIPALGMLGFAARRRKQQAAA